VWLSFYANKLNVCTRHGKEGEKEEEEEEELEVEEDRHRLLLQSTP